MIKTAIDYIKEGDALYSKGEKEKALESYHKATLLNPNNTDALNSKGLTLAALG